jgi:hypothetical protein
MSTQTFLSRRIVRTVLCPESGSGTVVQLLSQMSNQLAALSRTVDRSSEQVKALYEEGGKHLAKVRELVSI